MAQLPRLIKDAASTAQNARDAASSARVRSEFEKAMSYSQQAQAAGSAEPHPKVKLQLWGCMSRSGSPFPFFVDGSTTVTTDDLSTENHGATWVQVVDKPPVENVPNHSLCCFLPHHRCLVADEIAASPDAAAVTTAIRPCAIHPGVFLHHRCMTMACQFMTEQSGRTFEALPLGSFCYACLQNCEG